MEAKDIEGYTPSMWLTEGEKQLIVSSYKSIVAAKQTDAQTTGQRHAAPPATESKAPTPKPAEPVSARGDLRPGEEPAPIKILRFLLDSGAKITAVDNVPRHTD